MRSLVIAAIVTPCLAVAQSSPKAQNLHDRIVEAAYNSSLLSPDLSPFHLRLDATFYDAAGKNPYTGIIETWHAGENSRTVITVGPATRTVVHSAGKEYVQRSGPDVPELADDLLNNFLSPGPSAADIADAVLELHVESFGKAKTDCIMLSQNIPHTSSAPMGLFPTYCFDPGTTRLRATYDFGGFTVLRNGMGTFHSKDVSLDLSLSQGTILRAKASPSVFMTFVPTDEFTPGPEMHEISTEQAHMAGGAVAGHSISKPQPIYPATARANHVSGTVVLHAIIGRDGTIRSLRPISAPDADLAISAIAAVRHWTYTPYLLNGNPVEVDTTITVNYNLNPY